MSTQEDKLAVANVAIETVKLLSEASQMAGELRGTKTWSDAAREAATAARQATDKAVDHSLGLYPNLPKVVDKANAAADTAQRFHDEYGDHRGAEKYHEEAAENHMKAANVHMRDSKYTEGEGASRDIAAANAHRAAAEAHRTAARLCREGK